MKPVVIGWLYAQLDMFEEAFELFSRVDPNSEPPRHRGPSSDNKSKSTGKASSSGVWNASSTGAVAMLAVKSKGTHS